VSGWRCRSARAGREPFPERLPHELNHLVLTGTLLEKPHGARSPRGDAVTMLRLGFPVRDPERPEDLWTLARCEVEMPAALARRSIPSLRVGGPVLAWGQLSDREATGDDSQWGVIVAATVHVDWDDGGRLGMVLVPHGGRPPDRIERVQADRRG
jgi:hypothetical protein